VGLDPDLWKVTTTRVTTEAEMRKYILTALQWHVQGTGLAFAIIDKGSGVAVGSTRYANAEPAHKRLEIGWTWIGRSWQKTHINTETKYLLLKHAFETLGCMRVEFKTDAMNCQSREALLRIGAKEEGTLRKHMIVAEGRIRDSVFYSVVDSEWPVVRKTLETMMKS